jgi:hypothetical protein
MRDGARRNSVREARDERAGRAGVRAGRGSSGRGGTGRGEGGTTRGGTGGGGDQAVVAGRDGDDAGDELGWKQGVGGGSARVGLAAADRMVRSGDWWAHQDSNLEPRDYESPALTIELWARAGGVDGGQLPVCRGGRFGGGYRAGGGATEAAGLHRCRAAQRRGEVSPLVPRCVAGPL